MPKEGVSSKQLESVLGYTAKDVDKAVETSFIGLQSHEPVCVIGAPFLSAQRDCRRFDKGSNTFFGRLLNTLWSFFDRNKIRND